MSASVRRAGAGDLEAAWSIVQAYFASDERIIGESRASFASYLAAPAQFWLAEDGGAVVGCAALRPLAGVPGAGEVRRMFVRPSHRGAGVADALMAALEAFAREAGYDALYLDTHHDFTAAIRLYERRGYARVDRYNDNPVATIFMRRAL